MANSACRQTGAAHRLHKKGQKKRVWSDDEKLSICAQAWVYGLLETRFSRSNTRNLWGMDSRATIQR